MAACADGAVSLPCTLCGLTFTKQPVVTMPAQCPEVVHPKKSGVLRVLCAKRTKIRLGWEVAFGHLANVTDTNPVVRFAASVPGRTVVNMLQAARMFFLFLRRDQAPSSAYLREFYREVALDVLTFGRQPSGTALQNKIVSVRKILAVRLQNILGEDRLRVRKGTTAERSISTGLEKVTCVAFGFGEAPTDNEWTTLEDGRGGWDEHVYQTSRTPKKERKDGWRWSKTPLPADIPEIWQQGPRPRNLLDAWVLHDVTDNGYFPVWRAGQRALYNIQDITF